MNGECENYMKIIGIDSSGMTASVAVVEDLVLTCEYSVNYKKTHSQTLVPMLDEIKKMTELDLATVDAIAIAKGPGSFTGLRIGSATAKGLGLALNIPIVEIPTTDGLAYNFYGTDKLICPLMDARRGQVYTGLYEFIHNEATNEEDFNVILPATAEPVLDTIKRLNELNRHVILLGDGVVPALSSIKDNLSVPYTIAPAHRNLQSAASIATLGAKLFLENKYVPASEHVPDYLRLSQAERERNEAQNA